MLPEIRFRSGLVDALGRWKESAILMSSPKEAFSKLDEWRLSRTDLKLTMLVDQEQPKTLFIQIIATDENLCLVSYVERGKRLSPRLDLSGASFEVGQRVIEVRRSDTDILKFEEYL
jgi:hypothetical protein